MSFARNSLFYHNLVSFLVGTRLLVTAKITKKMETARKSQLGIIKSEHTYNDIFFICKLIIIQLFGNRSDIH